MQTPEVVTRLIAVGLVSATVAACLPSTGRIDKVGGADAPVILRIAEPVPDWLFPGGVHDFLARVDEQSDGALRLEPVLVTLPAGPDAERDVIDMVAAGEADLGVVGTGVFDLVGLRSFRAFTAPMLIDSYALEEAVLASDIPDQAMRELSTVGMTGLAIVGAGMRRPVAVDDPIVTLDDWRDRQLGVSQSKSQAHAIELLGGVPRPGFTSRESFASGELDGLETDLQPYVQLLTAKVAPYLTINVNLWPRTMAIIGNPGRLARLTDDQRHWLAEAASGASATSVDLVRDEARSITDICQTGGRLASASAADLEALRKALAPAFVELDRDATTRRLIAEIRSLKAIVAAEPDVPIPPGCTGRAPNQLPASGVPPAWLEGSYRWTMTREDAISNAAEDNSAANLASFPWIFTMVLDDGTWTLTGREADGLTFTEGQRQPFFVTGDMITFVWLTHGYELSFRFSRRSDGTLDLRSVPPMNPGDDFVWTTNPWTKLQG